RIPPAASTIIPTSLTTPPGTSACIHAQAVLGGLCCAEAQAVASVRDRAERAAHWVPYAEWTDGWDIHGTDAPLGRRGENPMSLSGEEVRAQRPGSG
ncbi:MAG TPA: hypothetical protein VMU34_12915, partial [Mycobacterium sp.]|nr:hypothetical protein [Mycobacterium sp.]